MSNHLAIASVTAVLRRSLQIVLEADVPQLDAQVTSVRPNAPASDLPPTGVNLVLYQASPNVALRNADLPTRRSDGSLLARPTAALDLHYLLSFYGNDAKLEPQILLACILRALHAIPVLSAHAISDTLADPTFAVIAGSDLGAALERVRFSPAALSLEEMSKLWSVFFQTPYVLSVAYSAGPLLIESAVSVRAAVPVREPKLLVVPQLQPQIDALLSRSALDQPSLSGRPILTGDALVLRGSNLSAANTSLRIDGVDLPPASVSAAEISVELPTTLRAGPHAVQVVQPLALGSPATPHAGALSSNVVSFMLSPTVTASFGANAVNVTVNPKLGKQQRVRLLMSPFQAPASGAQSYAFEAPARDLPGAPEETAAFSVPISGITAGVYLVRIQVDGAESPLGFDPTLGYDGPKVTIP